jgi:hypothetical protein
MVGMLVGRMLDFHYKVDISHEIAVCFSHTMYIWVFVAFVRMYSLFSARVFPYCKVTSSLEMVFTFTFTAR